MEIMKLNKCKGRLGERVRRREREEGKGRESEAVTG